MKLYAKNRYALALSVLLAFFVWTLLSPVTANAYQNNNLDKDNVPNYVFAPQPGNGTQTTANYEGRCTDTAGNNWSVGQNSWISSSNGTNFSATSVTVPYGTSSVGGNVVLYNALCFDYGSQYQVIDTWHRVSSVTASNGASVSGVAPNTIVNVGYPSVANKNTHVAVNVLPITITLPSNLAPGTYTFNVTLNNVARINKFRNGVYQCVQSGGNRTGYTLLHFVGCAQATSSIPYIITVTPPPVRYDINSANCKVITGWLFEPSHTNGNIYNQNGRLNNTTGSMLLHLYKNGVNQGQFVSNVDSPDVNAPPPAGYGIDGKHRFIIDISGMTGTGTDRFVLYMLGINSDGTVNNNNPAIYDGNIGPCFTPVSCNPLTQNKEINEGFQVNAVGGRTTTYVWSGDGVAAFPLSIGPTYQSSYSTYGTYKVKVTDGLTTSTDCVIKVGKKPYLQVFGGDVQSGGSFAAVCSPNTSAGIDTYNKGSASYAGSGTSLAAFALGHISQFVSQMGGASMPKNLTFSNSAGNVDYGGSFGDTFCVPNYGAIPDSAPSVNLAGDSILKGNHYVDKYNSSVTISGPINYDDPAGWGSISDIPSFYLIVRGNIYIDKSITQLDGTYIALPDPNDPDPNNSGNIYTCTDGSTLFSSGFAADNCRNQLTINGSFVARSVKFLRTPGDINNSTIAETFVYGPEMWLTKRSWNNPTTKLGPWDKITNLPPVL